MMSTGQAGRNVKHPVVGSLALVEDGKSYNLWPVDPKGSSDQGWTLTFDTGLKFLELGVFKD